MMNLSKLRYVAMAMLCLNLCTSCEEDDEINTDPMNLGEGKVYVIGHKNPDTDAVTSAMAYANLLRQLGYDCEARVAGALNKETSFIMDTFRLQAPELMSNAAGQRIILVDHSEYIQAVDGLKDAKILKVVDNHKLGSVTNALSYDTVSTAGSTCTIVYYLYKNNNVTIDPTMARIMLAGILSDTGNLKQAKSFKKDSTAVDALISIAGINMTDSLFYTRMHSFADDFSGMTDNEIFESDYKGYEHAGYKYGVAAVDVTYDVELADMRARMSNVMESYLTDNGLDLLFCKMDADTIDCSTIFYVGKDAETIAEKAFLNMGIDGVTSEKKDGYILITPHISRKTVVTPQIDKVLDTMTK
ncbi:MAG: DHH family phosphoesterase [Paludibacteraceae bacterium]|nr:DHH family phosphoesterase [Paludibacteraceae bacterium]